MDAKDEELRQVIVRLWPLHAKKMLNLLIPPRDGKCRKLFLLFLITLQVQFVLVLQLSWKLLIVCFTELTYEKLTVGKIYAGLLIVENWKAFKQGIQPGEQELVGILLLHVLTCN